MTGEFGLCGYVIDAPRWGELRAWPRGAVVVGDGRILAVGDEANLRADWPNVVWRAAEPGAQWLIAPGMIDVHAHLPQYPAVARVERELLPWLQRHIFPREKAFTLGREELAEEIEAFFTELAANGTTTAMLYAAVWGESCDVAFAAAERAGLRIALGKVMMDVGSYGGGAEWPAARTREVSLRECRELIAKWHGRDAGRLRFVVSPRFALTCSRELMAAAAELAAETGCAIQTHLSENHAEIARAGELFPEAASYTDVYARAGLLTPRSVLGHCVHLTEPEVAQLAAAGAKVAHCPTSNFFLNSGICPLDRLRAAGLGIGLGSDVAGGPELNLWQVMRSAIEGQKARRFHDGAVPELTPGEAFHLATAAGAEVTGWGDTVGQLTPGYEADVAVWDVAAALPARGRFALGPDGLAAWSAEEVLALMIYRGGPAALVEAWVRGRSVCPNK